MNKALKINRFSWVEYILSFICFGIFGALPGFMYGNLEVIFDNFFKYIHWYLLYWGVISCVFCLFTAYQKYKAFDEPIAKLSEATKLVARGDFSVYLEPYHLKNKYDYLDSIIMDFNTMVKELGSLETMKTDFISNVSHEIKTPLSVIQNYTIAIQKEDISAQQKNEYTQIIMTATNNLTDLVTNILSLNKLENQGIIPPSEPYNICRQLMDCVLSFESLWEKKNISFNVEVEDRAYLNMDESMVEIIWRNLISNAIKFTPKDGIIKIKQTSTESQIIVEISDNGIGMSEETQKHVYDKFYQGDHSHSREGNGLGLSLVWRVVELLDGSIRVKSEENQGTTFTVKLNVLK